MNPLAVAPVCSSWRHTWSSPKRHQIPVTSTVTKVRSIQSDLAQPAPQTNVARMNILQTVFNGLLLAGFALA